MVKEYRVEFRCAASAGVWVEERARLRGTSRSDVWREIMRRGLASYDKAGVSGASPLTRADERELAWWRHFSIKVRNLPRVDSALLGHRYELVNEDDAHELRQWRAFAERTAIHGDPARQVTPDIDVAGWTFMVIPSRDEHLEIA